LRKAKEKVWRSNMEKRPSGEATTLEHLLGKVRGDVKHRLQRWGGFVRGRALRTRKAFFIEHNGRKGNGSFDRKGMTKRSSQRREGPFLKVAGKGHLNKNSASSDKGKKDRPRRSMGKRKPTGSFKRAWSTASCSNHQG